MHPNDPDSIPAEMERNPRILGGELVFKGTRVSVSHVSGLILKGVPLEELRQDFPHLSERCFELARAFAEKK